MRAWMSAAAVALAVLVSGGCGGKKDPPACPTCPTCPEPATVLDAPGPAEYDGYSFKLVEKDGKVGFVATSSKGRVVVIPLDPRTRMFADGKEGTAGQLLMFAPSTGGCPCRLPACWPYCRVADPVLGLDALTFWGGADVPKWPVDPAAGGAPAPGEPAPGGAAPAPAPAPQ